MRSLTASFAILLMTLSNLCSAADWIRTGDLPLREADAAERARIRESLEGTQIRYNFDDESTRVLVHDGDLAVRGHFDNGDLLVVHGDLIVEGTYDDYLEGIGVLVVEGDMRAHDVYSWGAIHVAGQMTVRDVLMTVYNDFTFEVAGEVNARLLLVSDKSSDFREGEIGISLTDDADDSEYEQALRQLLPEAFTGPGHFELELDPPLYVFQPDQDWLRERMHQGRSPFRTSVAPPALVEQALQALAADADTAQLKALIAEDPLLAQLVAARPGLAPELVDALAARGDPRVDQWLGQTAPWHLADRDPRELSEDAARALALNENTPAKMVAALAEHPLADIRVLIASREQLADASLDRLQADDDAGVRERFWRVHAWQTAFGWNPGEAAIAARLVDEAAGVRDAMVQADLDAGQFAALVPRLTPEGLAGLARQLREIRERRVPSRLASAEVDTLALRLLDLPRASAGSPRDAAGMRTFAWLALDPANAGERMRTEVESAIAELSRRSPPGLDLLQIASHARQGEVLQRLAGLLGPPQVEELAEALARNPRLPLPLQLHIVERAAAGPAGRGEIGTPTPEVALDELLQNDHIHPDAIDATLDLILRRGIRPEDGSYQNSFFHLRKLPATAIERLDRRLRGSEDWALTLMLQAHADRAQLTRALARGYDDEAELQAELAAASKLDDEGFWLALAQASARQLREAALHPAASAAAVAWLIDHPDPELGWQAWFHPRTAIEVRTRKLLEVPVAQWDSDLLDLPAPAWSELARSAPLRAQRRAAYRRAADAAGAGQ